MMDKDLAASMARRHAAWAQRTGNRDDRRRHTEDMNLFYSQALYLNPSDFRLLTEWALEDMRLGAGFESVKKKLNRSLQLNREFYQTFDALGDLNLLFHKPEEALAAYQNCLTLVTGEKNEPAVTREIRKKMDAIYTIYPRLKPKGENFFEERVD